MPVYPGLSILLLNPVTMGYMLVGTMKGNDHEST